MTCNQVKQHIKWYGLATILVVGTLLFLFHLQKPELEPNSVRPQTTRIVQASNAIGTNHSIHLPLIIKKGITPPSPAGDLVMPEDFLYLGAFRLPGGFDPPRTFAYGGNAMTHNPDGDPEGSDSEFTGSLFITGHDRVAYGGLPDGGQVAEVSIPEPIITEVVEELNPAQFIQHFANVAEGQFSELNEMPTIGMQYLNIPEIGPKLHIAWGAHLQPDDIPSHGWFNPTLTEPGFQGTWFIGHQNMFSVNGYMFSIPIDWASLYTGGHLLATGRMRDGGQGGMGPTLFAYKPWDNNGAPMPPGTHLEEVPLLLYENSYQTEDIVRAMNSYQHPDSWEGGAWLTTSSGKEAVLLAGTKSVGDKYWYGYVNPLQPSSPCVDTNVSDFPTCRMADGTICPPEDFNGCCDELAGTCASYRGWWSTHFEAQLILFNPADLAQVATGQMEPWEPQPYAVVRVDQHLFLTPPDWEIILLGQGNQRRFRIGDAAYDHQNDLLYVLELYADGAKPVVHVWKIQ